MKTFMETQMCFNCGDGCDQNNLLFTAFHLRKSVILAEYHYVRIHNNDVHHQTADMTKMVITMILQVVLTLSNS